MTNIEVVSVTNEDTDTISLEIAAYKNTVNLSFVESIEARVAVHNTDDNAHENLQNQISLKANTSDMETALNTKADNVAGKGLSTNDLTNDLKTNYDTAYTNNHYHNNSTLLDSLISSGDGTQYLANDGSYKTVGLNKFGNCTTASGLAAKTVTLNDFSLVTGLTILVTFDNANTATAPTLNVNSTGAIAIYDEAGNAVSSTNPAYFPAGSTVEFTYDGTYWVFENRIVESYVNGSEWYDIYANGKINQGGYLAYNDSSPSTTQTVTFLIEFKDTNYFFNRSSNSINTTPAAYYPNGGYYSLTTSTITVYTENSAISPGCKWYACGY